MKTVGSVSKIIENIEAEEIFKIWSDVDNWHSLTMVSSLQN